jgi:hypothetical protein
MRKTLEFSALALYFAILELRYIFGSGAVMSASTISIKKYLTLSAVFLGLVLFLPSAAHAGFGWTPAPSAAPSSSHESTTANKSTPPAVAGPLTPEPDSANTLPVPVGPVETGPLTSASSLTPPAPHNTPEAGMKTMSGGKIVEAKPTSPAAESIETPSLEQPSSVTPVVPSPSQAAEKIEWAPTPAVKETLPLQGFGKDLPLVLALRQIVPVDYAYGFASNDLAGTRIDWQGGKPWPSVLSDSLSAAGLRADISDKAVLISKMAGYAPITPTLETVPQNDLPVPVSPAPAETSESQPLPLTDAPTAQSAPMGAEKPVPQVIKSAASKFVWTARPGATLKEVLSDWSKTAKVELDWVTPYDYPIGNAFTFKGTFEQAVDSLLGTYSRESPRPRGRLYPNLPEGPSVLMVN